MKKIFNVAAYQGHQEIVKALLNHAANIEAKDNDGNTPLFFGIFLYNCWI
jgi:ankyrin repeat protein